MPVLTDYQQELMHFLQTTLTQARIDRFAQVLNFRTRWLTVVIADVFIEHNTSAVLRSCDACGVQNVHVVESYNEFQANAEVALGAEKWLTLKHYQGRSAPLECVQQLREQGYQIVATSPHAGSIPIQELTIEEPVALFFGNEKSGLDQSVIEAADAAVYIPMTGFVESFNISVAAAISIFHLMDRIRASQVPWQLTPEEREILTYEWTRKSVRNLKALELRFNVERKRVNANLDGKT